MLTNNRTGIIYKATCTKTELVYVGQTTTTLALRKRAPLRDARKGSNTLFHRAIREFGEDAFVWDVLADEIPQAECLSEYERFYIRFYDTLRNGYNSNQGGGGNNRRKQLPLFERSALALDSALESINPACLTVHDIDAFIAVVKQLFWAQASNVIFSPKSFSMLRRRSKWSQKQIGNRMKPPVHQTLVSKWERGHRTPNSEEIARLAEILDVDVMELANDTFKACFSHLLAALQRLLKHLAEDL